MPRSGSAIDRAVVITIFGLFALMPPILTIFDREVAVFGIPLLHLYCFVLWLLLIVASAWISAQLRDPEREGSSARSEPASET
jgi:hypothetical protein